MEAHGPYTLVCEGEGKRGGESGEERGGGGEDGECGEKR